MIRRSPSGSCLAAVGLLAATLAASTAAIEAKQTPPSPKAAATPPAAAAAVRPKGYPKDLPMWQPPAAYSVDLVVASEGHDMVMRRSIDGARVRTEVTGSGQDIVMIETGDAKGTSYTIMPSEKRAFVQSRAGLTEAGVKMPDARAEPLGTPPAEFEVEDLGPDPRDGRALRKLRFALEEGTTLAWFDPATGAPVRMESDAQGHKSAIEWKNLVEAPQPARLFEVPKGYEVTDMDALMAQMKSMQGRGGMAGMPGVGGMTGMAGGMAGGMAQSFGQDMGGSLGASLGGALGGPLGAVAGQYIGGKVGGMIAKKAADVVIPGN